MGDLLSMDARRARLRPPKVIEPLTLEEMRAEWRAQEMDLIDMCAEQMEIAEALWPEGGEGPEHWRDAGVSGAELVAGVKSLHEYSDRLVEENERLRAEIAALRAEVTRV